MSWLSAFINNNRNFVGNMAKNAAPLLPLIGVPPAGAAFVAAAGEGMKKGANLGSIARSGMDAYSLGAGALGAKLGGRAGMEAAKQAGTSQVWGAVKGGAQGALNPSKFAPGSQAVGGSEPIPGAMAGETPWPQSPTDLTREAYQAERYGGVPSATVPSAVPSVSGVTPQTHPWYSQLLQSAKADPLTAMKIAGGVLSLPGEMQLNDAKIRNLNTTNDYNALTLEQERQRQENMNKLRALMTANYR